MAMSDCQLAFTGSNTGVLVGLAVLLAGSGISLLMITRRPVGQHSRPRHGIGTAVLVALAVGAAVLTSWDVHSAEADSCPSGASAAIVPLATTTTSTTAPATSTTMVGTSTTVPSTTTTTIPAATTTTVPETTTTVAPVPDLTPKITGPLVFGPGEANYDVTVSNVGSGTTAGPMTFTVTVELVTGPPPVTLEDPSSSDWSGTGSGSDTLTLTSDVGLVLAPGDVSTVTFTLAYRNENPASMTIETTLPTGIGGETNGSNNSASLTVTVPPPPP